MTARIFKPARNAMQSGTGKSQRWMLEFEPAARRDVEPLMGWTSSSDMLSQIHLWFDSKEEAIAYATRNGLAYQVVEPGTTSARRALSYSDNFRFNRVGVWTH